MYVSYMGLKARILPNYTFLQPIDLKPSTKLKDLNTKYEMYQDFGIPYYFIVDPEEKEVKIYQLDASKEYQDTSLSEGLIISQDCTIYPDLESIFNWLLSNR